MNSTLQRRSNGTYVPGVSGNPRGRPPGLVAFKNLLSEKLPPEELAEILAAKCREGDTQALKFVGERYWPRTETVTLHAENAEQVDARWQLQMQQASEELRVLLDGYDAEEADVSPLADRP